MERRQMWWALPALVAFVALSSYLGLLGRSIFWADLEGVVAFGFMGAVWGDSILADVAFALGSIVAAVSCWHLAREHLWAAIFVGAFAHALVYLVSFLLLGEIRRDAGDADLPWAAWFVLSWGFVGLAFAAFAPPLARRWWDARAGATDDAQAAGA